MSGQWARSTDYRNWRPQGTPDHLLIYTLAGKGQIQTDKSCFSLGPGDWWLYRPQTPQDYRTAAAPGTWTLLWAHVHPPPGWTSLLDWPEPAPGIRQLQLNNPAVRERVEAELEAMVRHDRSPRPMGKALAMNALERALLLANDVRLDRQNNVTDPRLVGVIDLMHRTFARPWTLDQLAATAHLSPSRFAHLFREQLGLPPLRYVEALRLQRAKQLLEQTGLRVGQVAAEVGYDDAFYFSRRFRRLTGRSPRAYRQHAAQRAR